MFAQLFSHIPIRKTILRDPRLPPATLCARRSRSLRTCFPELCPFFSFCFTVYNKGQRMSRSNMVKLTKSSQIPDFFFRKSHCKGRFAAVFSARRPFFKRKTPVGKAQSQYRRAQRLYNRFLFKSNQVLAGVAVEEEGHRAGTHMRSRDRLIINGHMLSRKTFLLL